jgi:hypothetical protein
MSKIVTQAWIRRARTARASAGRIHTLENHGIVTWWVPKLAGKYVRPEGGEYKFRERRDAIDAAKSVRAGLRDMEP